MEISDNLQEPPPVPELLDLLRKQVTNIQGALTKRSFSWTWRPKENEWSLTEILCHLRDVEIEVHQARYKAIIASENAFLPGVSADEWAKERNYQETDGEIALTEFVTVREETIRLLEALPEEMWSRQGRHAFFGPTSMHELLVLMVRHDGLHWEQIKSSLASQELGEINK
jgi:hypothetical protein